MSNNFLSAPIIMPFPGSPPPKMESEPASSSSPGTSDQQRETPSMIPQRKPIGVASKLIAAEKLKRRSVNTLRLRVPVIEPRMNNAKASSLVPQPPIGRQPLTTRNVQPRPIMRNVVNNGVSNTKPVINRPSFHSGRGGGTAYAAPARGRAASAPVIPRPVRPLPVSMRGRGAAKTNAEEAIQKKKPPPFVSRREQQLQRQLSTLENEKNQLTISLANAHQDINTLENSFTELQTVANNDAMALRELRATYTSNLEQLRQWQATAEQRGTEINTIRRDLEHISSLYEQTRVAFQSKNDENTQLKEKLWHCEKERRYLHNQVMELKGNIRVFCRVRPLLSEEFGAITTLDTISFPDNDKKLEIRKAVENSLSTPMHGSKNGVSNSAAQTFEFDKVFGPESTQTEVFEELSQLVQSAIDGYNICVFAYGQTGSGKTFTMEGPPLSMAQHFREPYGMIELSMHRIFDTVAAVAAEGWEYTVEASFIEIYNESIFDLLTKDPSKVNEKLEIRMVPNGSPNEVDVAGLTRYIVTSADELQPLLQIAQNNRTWAATKCNDQSSRSHSIFRLRLLGTNATRGVSSEGMINLVDLAGSENLKKSESVGVHLKEAQKINTSLMTLGKVIMALNNGDRYIPYRESKLTHLLQNSLGGNSKTLMFVNINPENDCVAESLNSLRFATQVNQCHMGTAKKNVGSKLK